MSVLLLAPGNIIYTPIQFLYTNELHMNASQVALFKLIVNAVGYFGFLLGMIRDRYNPLGMGDRGYFVIFGAMYAVILFVIPLTKLTIPTLGAGLLISGLAGGLIGAAYQALMRNISEARMMSGRMSTAYQLMSSLVGAVALLFGGIITDRLHWQDQMRVVAGIYVVIALFGLWKPGPFLNDVPQGSNRDWSQIGQEFKLLLRLRGFWVAVAIWTIWNFSPASLTPMMFFLTKNLHMTGKQFAGYNSWFALAFIPGTLLFGPLCKRFRLWPLLLVATFIAIPQWMPAMFIHTPFQSYEAAIFMGLTGGLANAAFYSLLFRSVPQGLAGTGMMLASSLALVVIEFGNVLGGHLYDNWGFAVCSYVTTGAYVLMLPLLFLLPKALVNPRDDEHVPSEEQLIAA